MGKVSAYVHDNFLNESTVDKLSAIKSELAERGIAVSAQWVDHSHSATRIYIGTWEPEVEVLKDILDVVKKYDIRVTEAK